MSKPNIHELIKDLYQVKEHLRDLATKYGVDKERRELMQRKDELLRQIRQELKKVSKTKAARIKKKLWEELGVII